MGGPSSGDGWFGRRLCALLLVPIPWPILKVLHQFQNAAHLANYKYPMQLLESGASGLEWTQLGPMGTEFTDTLRGLHFSFLGVLGRMFIPINLRTVDLDLFPPSDRFCHSLLDYMWVHPQDGGNSYPSIYATREEVDLFVRICGLEMERLSEDEKRLLGPLRAAGAIPIDVLHPATHGGDKIHEELMASRAKGVAPYAAEPLPREELMEVLNSSGKLWANSYDPAFAEKYWKHLDMRKMQTVQGWGGIAEAITNGEVASFDARPLFPSKVFNITMDHLASLEGADADRVVMWNTWKKPASLRRFSGMVEEAKRRGDSTAAYANTKRFGKFFAQLPNVAAALGLEEEVLRAESFLWLGNNGMGPHSPGDGGLHFDEEANVYVQLAGEQFMLVIPTNFTGVSFGSARHVGLPSFEELVRDPYFKQVPVHLVHMKPGDGITFPGRTYHYIMSPTPSRIAVNFFYIPKWRRMEYTPSDWYSQEADKSLVRLAIRQLWARSFARLYDETGKSIVFMGQKLEYN